MKMMNLRMRNLDLMGHQVQVGGIDVVPGSWIERRNLKSQMNWALVMVLVSSFSWQMLMLGEVPP